MISPPLVSAVMVTGKTPEHEGMARLAVKCFLKQTYTHTELVIINDGPYTLDIQHPAVHETRIGIDMAAGAEKPKMALGHLRNLGIAAAKGDYIIQWDDDDYHHPHRILYQMAHMPRRDMAAAVLLTRQVRVSLVGKREAFNIEDTNGIAGTVLHRRLGAPNYPDTAHKGEDADFLKGFGDNVILLDNDSDVWPGPALYVRVYHGRNTWDEAHVMGGEGSFTGSWGLNADEREYLRLVLAEYGGVLVP